MVLFLNHSFFLQTGIQHFQRRVIIPFDRNVELGIVCITVVEYPKFPHIGTQG